MLPYGMIRYHGAPADLRDIPLGTILHGRFYLPPDPKVSSVPEVGESSNVYPYPAENHAVLLEDEVSFCLREGMVWKLKGVELNKSEGVIIASRMSQNGDVGENTEEKLTIDATTSIWRGREKLSLADLITESVWPANGKKALGGQTILLGLTWQPKGNWITKVNDQFHVSDIWLDDIAMQRATQHQSEVHKELIRSRWMPAWVDSLEYGKSGHATVTVTLFGGMDSSLYADFKTGNQGQIAAAETNLKFSDGFYGHDHMAIKGIILEVIKQDEDIPSGSSGIKIRLKLDLVLEGFRPGNIVRIRPMSWPNDSVPREEFVVGGSISGLGERFPDSDVFPKYDQH
ncbi:hypothetical protein [Calycomorphotria hydatis]|nr:hypothetical protein [Calycomorphotria hydatis]